LPWEKVTDYRDYFLDFLRFVLSEGLGKTNGGKQEDMGKARGWSQGMVERVALGERCGRCATLARSDSLLSVNM
jgi:hypothetical protein